MENFPFAGIASVLGALGYLVNATANYKSKTQAGMSEDKIKLLLVAEREAIMGQVRQLLTDRRVP